MSGWKVLVSIKVVEGCARLTYRDVPQDEQTRDPIGSSPRSKTSNAAALSKLQTAQANAAKAQAKADAARAKASLVRANIEASGKQVIWDPKSGQQKVVRR